MLRAADGRAFPDGAVRDWEFRMKNVWPIVFGIAAVAYGYFYFTGRSR